MNQIKQNKTGIRNQRQKSRKINETAGKMHRKMVKKTWNR